MVSDRYDAVVVGASLAGCATAIQLGRSGASVALVEKSPDSGSFKRTCSHFIQAGTIPTLERLELLEPIMASGGVRSRFRARMPQGWIDPPPDPAGYAVNLRRELLDPLVREAAASTPGVELMLGRPAVSLLSEGGAVRGVAVEGPDGTEARLHAQLVVGADGRDSRIAELAGVKEKTLPHGRFAYGAYYEGVLPPGAPDATAWMMDPEWAAAFPTDSGLVFYGAMPTKDRLPEFKRGSEKALVAYLESMPDPPPIREAKRVSPIVGKIEMPNRIRGPIAPGLALVGDAALAADPLFGVGCGWAFQSGEWLADSVAPALRGAEPLKRGLARYRRRHWLRIRPHAFQVNGYSTGRPFDASERMLFTAAVRDPKVAAAFDAFGTRRTSPPRAMARAVPRAIVVNARHALRGRREDSSPDGTRSTLA